MSRARRLLLGGVAVLVVLVVLVLAGVLAVRALHGPDTAGDPAAGPAVAAPRVAQDRPGTVLLVPGYGGSTSALEVLAARLRAAGHRAVVVRLPGDGTGDLRADVPLVQAAARDALAAGAPSVDVVGYSAGGVVARLWQADGGTAVTRRVVTLGSPHHGTSLARLGSQLVPGLCPQACQQLVPGSALLAQLDRGDETPDGPGWLSLWTAVDGLVTPPDSARLAGAVDVRLQDVCPGASTSHGQLPTDPQVQGLVLQALSAAPLTAPRSCPA